MKTIAHIKNDFQSKFGIPRQSGIVERIQGKIVFEPEYRTEAAFRGLEDFSHIWIIWGFSEVRMSDWSPTVRPPLLGGNKRMGVFATRSPFRPNPLGLSSVRLEKIEYTPDLGPVLTVSGADLMDGTPIYDIKPYLAYTDSHPEASGGFTDGLPERSLEVNIPEKLKCKIPPDKLCALTEVLAGDPRPSYIDDPEREFGFPFAGLEILFTVSGKVLTVTGVSASD